MSKTTDGRLRIVPIFTGDIPQPTSYQVQRRFLFWWFTDAEFSDEYHTQLFIDGGNPRIYEATKHLWEPIYELTANRYDAWEASHE